MLRSKKPPQPPQTYIGLMLLDEVVEQVDRAAGYRQRAAFVRKAVAEKLAREAEREAA